MTNSGTPQSGRQPLTQPSGPEINSPQSDSPLLHGGERDRGGEHDRVDSGRLLAAYAVTADSVKHQKRELFQDRRSRIAAVIGLAALVTGGALLMSSDIGPTAKADDDGKDRISIFATPAPSAPLKIAPEQDRQGRIPGFVRNQDRSLVQPPLSAGTRRPTQIAMLPRTSADAALAIGRLEDKVGHSPHVKSMTIQPGDTFQRVLVRAGVPKIEARRAITAMRGVYDPRRLRAGRKIRVSFGVVGMAHNRFISLRFDSAFDRRISVQRQQSGHFTAAEVKKTLKAELVRGDGTVNSSLFRAGLSTGVPAAIMVRLIHLYSFNVDFQRDVRKGDKFEVLYRHFKDEDGKILKSGALVYAALTLRGTTYKLYSYNIKGDDLFTYFDEKGRSNRRALMRTPIDGARLSSNFGYRRHPILGYTKLHTGIDFAAPRGTPIYAAGNGTVEMIGRYGGYGNYIRLRHNKTYHTAYAHMRGFKRGLKKGSRVKQGQVIGYVGTTGRSTGPHLHYEVLKNRKHINPMTLRLPSGRTLRGKQRKKFIVWRKAIDAQFAKLGRQRLKDAPVTVVSAPILNGCINGIKLDPSAKGSCN